MGTAKATATRKSDLSSIFWRELMSKSFSRRTFNYVLSWCVQFYVFCLFFFSNFYFELLKISFSFCFCFTISTLYFHTVLYFNLVNFSLFAQYLSHLVSL